MGKLPKRITERIAAGLRRFQPILQSAKARDVNESDTVVIVTDLLHDILGYDKYSDVTSEHMIRSTFCDLAVKVGGSLAFLVEVKAIGHEAKEQYVKQAVDYAANQGVDWVILTNGICWNVYKVLFGKPVVSELVISIDLLALNHKEDDDLEKLGLIAKEGWERDHLAEYQSQREALSRYTIGSLIVSDTIVDVIRKTLRKMSPDVKITNDEIRAVLETDVIKRDVLDGDKAVIARKQVSKAINRVARAVHTAEPASACTAPGEPIPVQSGVASEIEAASEPPDAN